MGRTDVVINSFFEDEKRFANVINQTIFQGKEIIEKEVLRGASFCLAIFTWGAAN